ncbi:hypothetical protein WICMUC_003574 [Wickerhamomyces mucosus]|uniref:Zn(2)-C6 fungal-type domain-containing protein n=1 Tax=Wickerhamomyces mucosus TaxID=1378264 RepID=A0A9P8TCW5_9ASCO|nr:hypothetical protein WICMUC_003574 [Wickerhamomyces mucosus]
MEDVTMVDAVSNNNISGEQLQPNQHDEKNRNTVKIQDDDLTDKPKKKRKKATIACVYCRRSHMVCSSERPCTRCIQRNIAHLCHDEPINTKQKKKAEIEIEPIDSSASLPPPPIPLTFNDYNEHTTPITTKTTTAPTVTVQAPNQSNRHQLGHQSAGQNSLNRQYNSNNYYNTNSLLPTTDSSFLNPQPFFFSEHAGSEFSSLNEFLSMLDDPELINTGNSNNQSAISNSMFNSPLSFSTRSLTNLATLYSPALSSSNLVTQSNGPQAFNDNNQNKNLQSYQYESSNTTSSAPQDIPFGQQQPNAQQHQYLGPAAPTHQQVSDSARDKFFLTAADPSTEISPEERLKQVINAKLEAGLLQPYNYAKGYARLQSYMDNYMNQSSKQRILKPLSIFRPAFRAIARTLKDVDLILVEENFERMLLDYDRVFTSMAIPACLWRRTGEIYRGNKEFAQLVEVSADDLKDGKLAIYELMSEESAVNFWEKYGAIAFDKGQKAVLTSCNLRTRDGRKRKTCCFSFTIRRDRYNIPSCIVGNFIPINP